MADEIIIETVSTEVIEVGTPGPQGATGANGTNGTSGQGVPVGGTTGQVLRKASGTNYDTEWAAAGSGSGSVTSVSLAGTGLSISGSPITTSGTITANVAYGTTAGTATQGNDTRIANIAANSITTAQGANSGGAGGTITMRGGITGAEGPGGNAGSINLRGSDDRSEGAFNGGSIDLSAFSGTGGSITSTGNSEGSGGSLNMSGNSFAGGSINTSGGGSGVGGSIDTSNDGGSINTRGTGSIGFGESGTRTTLTGTATADRAIDLPDASGTLALTANTIASTIVDAKGDLIVGTAADTVARLPVGATNGHVLTVDAAEAGGMKWAAASGGGVTTGGVDNAVLRANGTGGSTSQSSDLVIDDAVVPLNITGDAGTDIVTAVGHPYTANQGVLFPTLTGGAGLTAATTNYFVRDISGDTFKVSTTSGGSAVNFTTNITAGTVIAMQANLAVRNNSSETNSALVFCNKGTGAFIVSPARPDGTASGGNARGANAICIGNRSAANQVAAGDGSVRIGSQSITAQNNSIAIGTQASATQNDCVAVGAASSSISASVALGHNASATGSKSAALGKDTAATLRAQVATLPFSSIFWSGQTTNNTATILNLDGAATNRFTIAASTALAVDILLVARRATTQDKWLVARRFLGIRRDGSNNTALIGTVQTLGTDQSAGSPSWTFALTADDTNEALQLEVTGATGETVEWRATAFYRVA